MKWLCSRCGAHWTARDDRPCPSCQREDLSTMILILVLVLVLVVLLLWIWGAI